MSWTFYSASGEAMIQDGGISIDNNTNNRVVTATGASPASLNGEAALTFDGEHLTVSDGNLVIGTAGHGIDFAAQTQSTVYTASAEILDHYEEGSWSPVIEFGGGSTGVTTNLVRGTYARIGRVVFIECLYRMTSKGTSEGSATVSGLPFACNASGADASMSLSWLKNISFSGFPNGQVGLNVSYVQWYESEDDGTLTALTHAEFANNSQFAITGHYEVA